MLTEEMRKDIVRKASERVLKILDTLSEYSRQAYIEKLINMLDDTHLMTLDFSVDMTPELPTSQEEELTAPDDTPQPPY